MSSPPKTPLSTLAIGSPVASSTPKQLSPPNAPRKSNLYKLVRQYHVRKLEFPEEDEEEWDEEDTYLYLINRYVRSKYRAHTVKDVTSSGLEHLDYLHFLRRGYEPRSVPINDIEAAYLEEIFAATKKRLEELGCMCETCLCDRQYASVETSF